MDLTTELFVRPDVVLLDSTATSREAVIREWHGQLAARPGVLDGDRLLFDLLERSVQASVCVSAETAMPHARTDAVERLMLGVGRLAGAGVAFDPEHLHIRLIFLVAVPKAKVDEYLAAIAAIARVLKHEPVRAGLLQARDAGEFCAFLAQGARP
ncbi:MAG: PTS sugar transporter subunit IIA [Opitutales bacterium]